MKLTQSDGRRASALLVVAMAMGLVPELSATPEATPAAGAALDAYASGPRSGCTAFPEGLLLGGQLDVNRAELEALVLLPHIGRRLAERIVREREERGPFRGVADLKRVQRLSSSRLLSIEGYVCFGEDSTYGGARLK